MADILFYLVVGVGFIVVALYMMQFIVAFALIIFEFFYMLFNPKRR
jgi:hypothetical protein